MNLRSINNPVTRAKIYHILSRSALGAAMSPGDDVGSRLASAGAGALWGMSRARGITPQSMSSTLTPMGLLKQVGITGGVWGGSTLLNNIASDNDNPWKNVLRNALVFGGSEAAAPLILGGIK